MVPAVAHDPQRPFRDHHCFVDLRRYIGFYEYYQIGAKDESDDTQSGSEAQGELIQTGMHSPWGILYQIIKETGWSLHYVLWKVNRTNLMLMMADRSHVKYGKKTGDEEAIPDTGSNLAKRFKARQAK